MVLCDSFWGSSSTTLFLGGGQHEAWALSRLWHHRHHHHHHTGSIIRSEKTTGVAFGRPQQSVKEVCSTYASLLRSIKSSTDLPHGKLIQAHIKKDGMEDDPLLRSLLIEMYGKCGCVYDAHQLFNTMPQRPMLAWKSIIRAFVQDGQCPEALQLFEQLLQEGFFPDKFTFVSILTACASLAVVAKGERIHALVVGNGFVSDIAVGTALVNMYGKCGSLTHCIGMFDDMYERKVIVWNALIAAHVKHGKGNEALVLFNRMQQEGVLLNRITYINILSACAASSAAHHVGEQVHARTWTDEFRADVVVGNAIINMYCRSGRLKEASIAFDGIVTQNMISWTSMIEAYTQQGKGMEALQLFERMQQQGALPDQVTFIGILETCANLAVLPEGKKLHARLAGIRLESDIVIGTAIVHMYGKCGSLEDAGMVFDKLPERNLISWTSMIALYSQQGQGEAFQKFSQMIQEGLMPDKVVYFSTLDACCQKIDLLEGKRMHTHLLAGGYEPDDNAGASLINLYVKCKSLEKAFRMFNNVSDLGVASWTAMIAACTEHGQEYGAFQLFFQMQQEGVMPDKSTFANMLDACASLTALLNGKQIHSRIVGHHIEADTAVQTSLVNMYGKCGNLKEAQATFNGVFKQNLISWTALIAAYAQHGEPREALQILDQLAGQRFLLDDATFVNVLSACGRAGFFDEGCTCFVKMVQIYGFEPALDHYCCMIDLLGRAGHLDSAEALIGGMPCQPSAVLWMALLGACRYQPDIERGEHVAKHVFELNPEKGGLYVVLSNIYAAACRRDNAAVFTAWGRNKSQLSAAQST